MGGRKSCYDGTYPEGIRSMIAGQNPCGNDMARQKGFTLIELLTVIAIIAILSAIIYPVYSRVKDSAYRSSDMSNLDTLRTALQLYHTDNGAYPPALLGYVTLYTSGPNAGNVVPANQLVGGLYPTRVTSIDVFRPAYDRSPEADPTTVTNAVWPTSTYINGDLGQQRYGPADGLVSVDANGNEGAGFATPLQYYSISGYDTAEVRTPAGTERELRYTLFWTGYGLTGGSSADSPYQLGYAAPPGRTVITWDSYFRNYNSTGAPTTGGKRDIVLQLSGSATPVDSVDMYNDGFDWGQTQDGIPTY